MTNNSTTIKKFPYSPILGWSISRYNIFETCKRRYYYHYYGKYDHEYPPQKIKDLKEMTSAPLGVGQIVHEMIKILLEGLLMSEEKTDRGEFLACARGETEEYCRDNIFSEVYYGGTGSVDIDGLFGEVSLCLTNFLDSDRFIWLTEESLENKGGWLIEPPGYGETRIDGLKAYCKVDFLFPLDGKLFILDWKTSKPGGGKYSKQLSAYSAWASFHYGVDPVDIYPILAYLKPEYSERAVEIDEWDFQNFPSMVRKETNEMYKYCQDVEANIPVDKTLFLKTDDLSICKNCNFRELCF